MNTRQIEFTYGETTFTATIWNWEDMRDVTATFDSESLLEIVNKAAYNEVWQAIDTMFAKGKGELEIQAFLDRQSEHVKSDWKELDDMAVRISKLSKSEVSYLENKVRSISQEAAQGPAEQR